MVVLNDGEHAAQMPDDARLPAMVDVAAAHDMGADAFLCPPLRLGLHDIVPLGLGAVLDVFRGPLVVIVRL